MPHKLERPSAALASPGDSDLGLVGHGDLGLVGHGRAGALARLFDGDAGGVNVIRLHQPARHGGRGRGHRRLPPLLQLAREQNRLEIPGNDLSTAQAFQFSHTK